MPLVAALLTGVFLIYALRVERRRNPDVSAALWIPFCWMFLIGSRYVSQWLNVGIVLDSPDDYLDGSPVDRAVFEGLDQVAGFKAGLILAVYNNRLASADQLGVEFGLGEKIGADCVDMRAFSHPGAIGESLGVLFEHPDSFGIFVLVPFLDSFAEVEMGGVLSALVL